MRIADKANFSVQHAVNTYLGAACSQWDVGTEDPLSGLGCPREPEGLARSFAVCARRGSLETEFVGVRSSAIIHTLTRPFITTLNDPDLSHRSGILHERCILLILTLFTSAYSFTSLYSSHSFGTQVRARSSPEPQHPEQPECAPRHTGQHRVTDSGILAASARVINVLSSVVTSSARPHDSRTNLVRRFFLE